LLDSLITSTSCKLRTAHPHVMNFPSGESKSPFREMLEGMQPVSDDLSCALTSSWLKREEGSE